MPRSTRAVLAELSRYESRNVTFVDPAGDWPIVWESAHGTGVIDAAGRRYLDLTAAFGVAAAGHANPRVVRAGQHQMGRLLHAMGDVHPHAGKAALAHELSRLTWERWTAAAPHPESARTLFTNSGFEAVEAALKTALLATDRPGVIAFTGAYHGLGHGALSVTHRLHFRGPFRKQLRPFARFVEFPASPADLSALESALAQAARDGKIGAVLVEPVQARGGIRVPPAEFLPLLRRWCDAHGALLVLDEIYTGFGRTGRWFATEHTGVIPDLICLGKALTGGFPLSACVGRSTVMDAWPPATGEAIHTSTFLGHPVGCAMALAQIGEIRRRGLVERSATLGRELQSWLDTLAGRTFPFRVEPRGLGLMAGVELRHSNGRPATDVALQTMKTLLSRGFIVLPEGGHSEVISLTPPLTIARADLRRAVNALTDALDAASGTPSGRRRR